MRQEDTVSGNLGMRAASTIHLLMSAGVLAAGILPLLMQPSQKDGMITSPFQVK